jgi:glutamate racemase
MIHSEPIAVLAGTPVDTQMGADLLQAAGLPALAYPLSDNPRQQNLFQLSSPEEKHAFVLNILNRAMQNGCRRALVYCNSLSSAVDFTVLAEETGMRIVTPLQVYRSLPAHYHRLGIVAANAPGLAGIEQTLYREDPSLELLSVSLLPLVLSIETAVPPETLVQQYHLQDLAAWFQSCGMEAMILGCTHFPYVKQALQTQTTLPLIDPAEEMIRLLTE